MSRDRQNRRRAPTPKRPDDSLKEQKPPLLFLFRHPETSYNAQARYQGGRDIPINRVGERQLKRALPYLLSLPFARIISSPLSRCAIVAETIARHRKVAVDYDARLKELHYGVFEGLTRKEIEKCYPELLKRWMHDPLHTHFEGGESFQSFRARVRQAIRELKKRGENLLVVSHGGPLRILFCEALKLPLSAIRSFQFDNAHLTAISSPFHNGKLLYANSDFFNLPQTKRRFQAPKIERSNLRRQS